MSYELLRHIARKYDEHSLGNIRIDSPPHNAVDANRARPSPVIGATCDSPTVEVMSRLTRRRHIIRAMLYGLQVFYSYLLMLVAMTYQVLSSFGGVLTG